MNENKSLGIGVEFMKNELFMAVDLGTSFIKIGVYSKDGDFLAGASESVAEERPAPGVFLQRGDALFGSVLRCIRKTTAQLKDDASRICAMAFTGQMAGSIGVDENWQDVTTWSCSLDNRYIPYAERQRRDHAD